jgi:hypothetical protein
VIVYLGFGNSDDKLGQRDWCAFQIELKNAVRGFAHQWLGDWHSYPDSIYQNACYAFHVEDDQVPELKGVVAAVAAEFKQDAIAWNEITATQFLGPAADKYTKELA